jgi:hypothetical protein
MSAWSRRGSAGDRRSRAQARRDRHLLLCPGMRPANEGSLLKRAMANLAAADLDGLVRIVRRKLEKIQPDVLVRG